MDGERLVGRLNRPILDLLWDDAGTLWALDGSTLLRCGAAPEAWEVSGEELVDVDGIRVVALHWEDGIGPVTWSARPGEEPVPTPEVSPRWRPEFVGTADGRYLVAVRAGLRGIWELPTRGPGRAGS